EKPLTAPTVFTVTWILRYDKTIQLLTLHGEVDPGPKSADEGPPGLQLVHDATVKKPVLLKPKLAGAAKIPHASCHAIVTVGGDGRFAGVDASACPDPLRKDAEKALSKAKYTARVRNGATEPAQIPVAVTY